MSDSSLFRISVNGLLRLGPDGFLTLQIIPHRQIGDPVTKYVGGAPVSVEMGASLVIMTNIKGGVVGGQD